MQRPTDQFAANRAERIECTDHMVQAGAAPMPVRVYRRSVTPYPAPIVFHLHGGAFSDGSLDSGRTVASLLAGAGAVVVSADYPLAPDHRFPQALEAIHRAVSDVHTKRAKWSHRRSALFVAGEEAGGNLAAGLALLARDRHAPPLAGQILLSPMLDPCMATCSLRQAEAGPVGCKWTDGWHDYLGSAANAMHPYASPINSARLAGVAPALVLTAEDDPMRDESLTYARRLHESGVAVRKHILSAPTGWPCAFSQPGPNNSTWASTVRDVLARFFAETLGLLSAVPPVQLSHA